MTAAPIIAGIGQAGPGKLPGMTAWQLQGRAAVAALADAGLTLKDVDGIIAAPIGAAGSVMMPAVFVASALGITPNYVASVDLAGASGCAMVAQADTVVRAGAARVVLCVCGAALLSRSGASDAIEHMASSGTAHAELELPYGPSLASLYAMMARRHMFEFGTTEEDFARIASVTRGHATLNPQAYKRTPLTIEEALAADHVADPLRRFDCSVVSDGAAAFVIVDGHRAPDLPQPPVRLLGAGSFVKRGYFGESLDPVQVGASRSGMQAYRAAGLTPADMDLAQLYDCFSITVLAQLEELGFVARGEAAGWLREGGMTLGGGKLPVNTGGGLLSGGHPGFAGGMLLVIEAVRQLRGGLGERQVPQAEVALVHGNGGVGSVHATLILGGEATR